MKDNNMNVGVSIVRNLISVFQCSQKPLKLFYKCLCVCHLKRLMDVAGQLKEDENLRMEKERPEVEREGLDWQDWLACYVFY